MKILVSRKNLPLIHLVPGVGSVRADMAETPHQRIDSGASSRLCRILLQPLAEGRIQSLVLRPRHQTGLLDQALVRTQSYILHTVTVYTISVYLDGIVDRCLIAFNDDGSILLSKDLTAEGRAILGVSEKE